MTLHLVAMPHTLLTEEVPTCAYTAKVAKFQKMQLGRDLIVYGTEGADVELLNEFERRSLFGADDANRLPFWPADDQWRIFNARAVAAITERAAPGDTVLIAGGYSQRYIHEALALAMPAVTVCEPFVGYEGITTDFCAFESNAWRHHVYGLKGIRDGRWFDTVIPNYFDVDEFPHVNQGGGDYLLFVGRVTMRKGIQTAAEIAQRAGMRLVVAGPGGQIIDGHLLGDYVMFPADNLEYVGPVGSVERAELMAGARAFIAPTLYIEPFGGVAVEAMLAGTPVIAPDFGAFTETVENGVTGQRFSSMQEALDALEVCDTLNGDDIRHTAIDRFSLEAVAPRFIDWFDKLDTLHGGGWYETGGTRALSPSSPLPTMEAG